MAASQGPSSSGARGRQGETRPFRPSGSFAWGSEPERPVVSLCELYWSDTSILRDDYDDVLDRKPERPVAVVRAPSERYPKVSVVVRTGVDAPEAAGGVHHPAHPAVGLNKDGVFAKRVKWARWEKFAVPAVRFIGTLADPYCIRVLAMAGARGQNT